MICECFHLREMCSLVLEPNSQTGCHLSASLTFLLSVTQTRKEGFELRTHTNLDSGSF